LLTLYFFGNRASHASFAVAAFDDGTTMLCHSQELSFASGGLWPPFAVLLKPAMYDCGARPADVDEAGPKIRRA
jgi:hypothetical protein